MKISGFPIIPVNSELGRRTRTRGRTRGRTRTRTRSGRG